MNRSRVSIGNIWYYIQGNIRYRLYYSKFSWMISDYIREQIIFRINSMNRQCYERGSCVVCGCTTTQLQMSNKACDGNCYPKMFSKGEWDKLKFRDSIYTIGRNHWSVDILRQKFIRYELG